MTRFTYNICFSILFLILFISCNKTPKELINAEKLMQDHPDSALKILQKISPTTVHSEKNKAFYGLLLFQALDKNYLPLKPDSVITFSIKYYEKANDKTKLATCYLYKGRMYYYANNFENATELYFKALDISNDNDNSELIGKLYSDLAEICFYQKEYKQARKKHFESRKYFIKSNNELSARYQLLSIAQTYRATKETKLANKYCLKAIENSKDTVLTSSALQEIGINFYSAKQYDSAEHYLRKSLCSPNKNFSHSVRYFTLADLYFNTDKFDSIYCNVDLALKYPINAYTKRECYRLLANTAYIKGEYKKMGKYMTKYQACTDSIRIIESQTKATFLEDLHKSNNETKATKFNYKILVTISIILLIVGSIVVYIISNKNARKKDKLNVLKKELQNKREFVSQSITKKLEASKALKAQVRKNAQPEQRIILDKEVYNTVLHFNNWEAFSCEINHAFNNIIITLQTNFPHINQKELRWCSLHLLNIPANDMILLLETTNDGLYKIKQRVASKLNLKATKDISSYLQSLVDKEIH